MYTKNKLEGAISIHIQLFVVAAIVSSLLFVSSLNIIRFFSFAT